MDGARRRASALASSSVGIEGVGGDGMREEETEWTASLREILGRGEFLVRLAKMLLLFPSLPPPGTSSASVAVTAPAALPRSEVAEAQNAYCRVLSGLLRFSSSSAEVGARFNLIVAAIVGRGILTVVIGDTVGALLLVM